MNHINYGKIDELKELDDDGSNSVLNQVIELYIKSTGPKLARMQEALSKREYVALKAEAHSLRSSSLNLGAEVLADLSSQVEYLKESANYHDIQTEVMSKIITEFDVVKKILLAI